MVIATSPDGFCRSSGVPRYRAGRAERWWPRPPLAIRQQSSRPSSKTQSPAGASQTTNSSGDREACVGVAGGHRAHRAGAVYSGRRRPGPCHPMVEMGETLMAEHACRGVPIKRPASLRGRRRSYLKGPGGPRGDGPPGRRSVPHRGYRAHRKCVRFSTRPEPLACGTGLPPRLGASQLAVL